MTIRAVVFDIGGVLAVTSNTGMMDVSARWERQLQLRPGELNTRMREVWGGGSLGTLSEEEVHTRTLEILGMSLAQGMAFMDDIWREYLGTLNAELAAYFSGLRPRYRTAILSNSFVGAREREQASYHFEEMCDFIIYSHEVGVSKPDRRIYALTCERLGVPPAEVVFLDDSEPCVVGAREFGMQAILFKDTRQAIADLEACLQAGAA